MPFFSFFKFLLVLNLFYRGGVKWLFKENYNFPRFQGVQLFQRGPTAFPIKPLELVIFQVVVVRGGGGGLRRFFSVPTNLPSPSNRVNMSRNCHSSSIDK